MSLRLRSNLYRPWRLSLFDRESCHGIDDPAEAGFAYRVEVGVGHGVHKVDGVGDAVLDGELDRVEIVTKGAAQREGVLLDALQELGIGSGRVEDVTVLVGLARVVGHDENL